MSQRRVLPADVDGRHSPAMTVVGRADGPDSRWTSPGMTPRAPT